LCRISFFYICPIEKKPTAAMSNSPLPPDLSDWIAVRDEHIAQLESALADARTLLLRGEGLAHELAQAKQDHLAYVSAYQHRTGVLQEEIQQWERNYAQLRLQKGGFGFKAMLAVSVLGTLVGVALGWLLFGHRDPQSVVFQRFVRESGFQVEYAVRQRQFDEAEKIVRQQAAISGYAVIGPQLDLIANLLSSAKQGFLDANLPLASAAYAVKPPSDTAVGNGAPTRTLAITEGGTRLHSEAQSASSVIFTLKKKDQVGQWDRTAAPEKIRLTSKGATGVAEDYWYEVETTEGQKGWVFGFFTNASLGRFRPDSLAQRPKVDSLRRDSVRK
jgi:hypothetical protein